MVDREDCEGVQADWEAAEAAYDAAWWAEFYSEMKVFGQGLGTAGLVVGAGACWTALEAVTLGAGTAACVGISMGAVGAGTATAGQQGHQEALEDAREAAFGELMTAEEAYCACLRGEDVETPDVSEMDITIDPADFEDEDEDADEDEECDCDEDDATDQFDFEDDDEYGECVDDMEWGATSAP